MGVRGQECSRQAEASRTPRPPARRRRPGPAAGHRATPARGGRGAAARRRRSDRHPASPREPCGLVRGAHDRVAFTAEAIKVAWATEGAHPLTLEFRDCPALPGGPGVITGVPVSGSWRQKRQRPSDVMGGGPRLPLPEAQWASKPCHGGSLSPSLDWHHMRDSRRCPVPFPLCRHARESVTPSGRRSSAVVADATNGDRGTRRCPWVILLAGPRVSVSVRLATWPFPCWEPKAEGPRWERREDMKAPGTQRAGETPGPRMQPGQ